MADLRADLLSGDATKQTGALMNTFAMLVGAGLSMCCCCAALLVLVLVLVLVLSCCCVMRGQQQMDGSGAAAAVLPWRLVCCRS